MKILMIIGSNPSLSNINPVIPFVGTKSLTVLQNWISDIQFNMKTYFDYYTINASNKIAKNPKVSEMGLDRLRSEFELTKPFAVVALGRYAALAAKKASLEFFELPHPSGLNRKLNDKTYVRGVLKECSEYLSERLG